MDMGIDFQEEYLEAKRLFDGISRHSEDGEVNETSYLLTFDELDVTEDTPETEILLKAVTYGGLKTPKAVSIEILKDSRTKSHFSF